MKKALLFLCINACSFLSYSQSAATTKILHNSVQTSCKNEVNKANSNHWEILDILSEIKYLKASEPYVTKVKFVQGRMNEIQSSTGQIISYLDSVKLSLLKKGANNVNSNNARGSSIIGRVHDDPCSPIELNLYNLKNGQNSYSFNTKDLGKRLTEYRTTLLELIGNYEFGGRYRYFRKFSLPQDELFADMQRIVRDSLNAQGTLEPGDAEMMATVYTSLTSFQLYGEPIVSGTLLDKIATITAIQYDILYSYNRAIGHWRGQISTGSLILSDFKIVNTSPKRAKTGEEIEVDIFLAGYDSFNEPVISIDSAQGSLNAISEGGKLKFTMGNSDAELSGTVKIRTKTGEYKVYPWKTTVVIDN